MFLKFVKTIFEWITFRCFGTKIYGIENIPIQGAGILASNHSSNWDPVLIGGMIPRMVYFIAKEELFKNYFLGKICRALGAFPVQRGSVDRRAMKQAFTILKRGDLLGIFPEGTRVRGNRIGRFHNGMASLAARIGVPIIPMTIIGSDHPMEGGGPIIVIGKPVQIKRQEATKQMIRETNDLIRKEMENAIKMYGERT